MGTLLTNKGWTDEARPPSPKGYGATPGAAAGAAAWSGGFVANKGWTDEARAASLAKRRAQAAARAAERDRMFEEQRKRAGEAFVENWYPRDGDGETQDPHYGETSPAAPYGFVDGTRRARHEPLYDRYGRPIIPRAPEQYAPKKDRGAKWEIAAQPRGKVLDFPVRLGGESLKRDVEWLKQVERATRLWGPFGEKKRFMEKHPGASEADWEKWDREGWERKKAALGEK